MDELGLPQEVLGHSDDPPDGGETVDVAVLEALAGQLVWKIGQDEHSQRIVVRLGYASATRSFSDLPKLQGVSDQQVLDALNNRQLVVEWIE
jgi:hypothetical protein